MVDVSIHYQERMDTLFGEKWGHRTLRTLFDIGSEEWKETTLNRKIDIIKKIIESGENLQILYNQYQQYYTDELSNKEYVADRAYESLLFYTQHLVSNYDPENEPKLT